MAAAEAPPLVISDMKMPGRDGIWLLEAFRERYPETAVIMLTGYGDTEAAVDCLRRGAVDYLLKPPKLTDLIRAIERALAKRRIELARKRYQKKLERKVRDRTGELRTALRNIQGTYQTTLLALVRGARRPRARDQRPQPAGGEVHRGHRRAAEPARPGARGDWPRRPAPRHREDRRSGRGAAQAGEADARRVDRRCAGIRTSATR